MANRPLTGTLDTFGEWFLPEDASRRVAGALRYTSSGTELDLNEAFSPMRGAIGLGDSLKTYPVVFGTTREGEAMTILHAHRAGMSLNFGSGGLSQPERLVSSSLLVGGHVPADFAYPEMRFRIPGLQIWLSKEVIHQTHNREESSGAYVHTYSIDGMKQDAMVIPPLRGKLEWHHQCQLKADPFSLVDVKVSGWVTIRPDEPKKLDWFLDQMGKITTMLGLISGSLMSPDYIKAGTGRAHQHVDVLITFANHKFCTFANVHEFFMLRSTMGVDLVDAASRWFEVYPKIHMPSELAISVFASEKLWLHVEFLSLMQALEGFHRALYEGLYMDEQGYASVKKALGDAIPAELSPDHKDALKSRIRYGNQVSLRKRLTTLCELLPQEIRRAILGGEGKIPGSWIDTRNYYTHWDEELRENVLGTREMYNANVRMRVLLRVLYLNLMGIPHESISRALTNHSHDSQHVAQLNARAMGSEGREAAGSIVMLTEERPPDATNPGMDEDAG
jgi:hypothetical protein